MEAVGVLEALDGKKAVSGNELAEKHGVSRNAVWKHIESLREEGFNVKSTGDGYRLNQLAEYGPTVLEYRLREEGTEYVGH